MTPDDISWADVVVCVQRSHEKAVLAHDPKAVIYRRRVQDPAYCRTTDWPVLAEATIKAAEQFVVDIEQAADR